jgi:hypothetical protein
MRVREDLAVEIKSERLLAQPAGAEGHHWTRPGDRAICRPQSATLQAADSGTR